MPDGPDEKQISQFISASFPSIWTFEILLLLKTDPGRLWRPKDLIDELRASEMVIESGVMALIAAGLATNSENQGIRYGPVNPELNRLVNRSEALYRWRPDAVRRMIVRSQHKGAVLFADAFRLRSK